MKFIKQTSLLIFTFFTLQQAAVLASGTMSSDEINNVNRTEVSSEEDKKRLSATAGLLAEYEIEAKKLISGLNDANATSENTSLLASQLLTLSIRNVEAQTDYYNEDIQINWYASHRK